MKGIFLIKKGNAQSAFELRDLKLRNPIEDEVLIAVEAFGLNYADVMARNGLYREAPQFPFVAGYEVVGLVEQAPGNEDLIGKRVVAFTRFGGYATHVITSKMAIAEIGNADASEALALATQYVTAYYMTHYCNGVHEGDRVMIHAAAGGVGTALVQLCKIKGAYVFGNAGSHDKLNLIAQNGVDIPINYREQDYEVEIRHQLKDERLDATFNPIAGSTFKKDMSLLGSGGRLFLYGGSERSGKKWGIFSTLNFVRKMGRIIPIGLMMRSKSIIGVNMLKIADNKPYVIHTCLNAVVELWKNKKIQPLVKYQFNATQISEAHELLENRNSVGKIVVFW